MASMEEEIKHGEDWDGSGVAAEFKQVEGRMKTGHRAVVVVNALCAKFLEGDVETELVIKTLLDDSKPLKDAVDTILRGIRRVHCLKCGKRAVDPEEENAVCVACGELWTKVALGQLEIDSVRGVIWFNDETGKCRLRISKVSTDFLVDHVWGDDEPIGRVKEMIDLNPHSKECWQPQS